MTDKQINFRTEILVAWILQGKTKLIKGSLQSSIDLFVDYTYS